MPVSSGDFRFMESFGVLVFVQCDDLLLNKAFVRSHVNGIEGGK